MNIINVLKISFITLLPFHVLFSFSVLVLEILRYFSAYTTFIDVDSLTKLVILFEGIYAILINQSIAYFLSTMYYGNLNKIISMTLSLVIFVSVETLSSGISPDALNFPKQTIIAIITPVISLFLMSVLLKKLEIYGDKFNLGLSKSLSSSFKSIVPYIVTFFLVTSVIYLINDYFSSHLKAEFFSFIDYFSTPFLLFFKTVFSHLLWFFGIHGSNFLETILPTNYHSDLFTGSLTAKEFYDIFVIIGGSGSCFSLLFAIFLYSKDSHVTHVGKISLPFVTFNISEILIFGIPIFLNFKLLIPFILTPVVNFIISYLVIVIFNPFDFNDVNLPWITPVFLNVYLVTDGNLWAVCYQFLLLLVGALVYRPFIKEYTSVQSSKNLLGKISSKFDLPIDTDYRQEVKFYEAQSRLISSHVKIDETINLLNSQNLEIFYQPKVAVSSGECGGFEALLRVKNEGGEISPPDFIIDIENAGLASVLDIWVCQRVKEDLDSWSQGSFFPCISINIFPYTLEDRRYVQQIIDLLDGYNICVEVLERRSSLNAAIKGNLQYLKDHGIDISLDDLGTGYTNFGVLYELPLHSVKIDRSIINFTNEPRGLVMYQNICHLCESLGYKIILEGIETQEQLDRLVNETTYAVQGWYYSKAVPFDQVIKLSNNLRYRKGAEFLDHFKGNQYKLT